jgi:hypothetical protein
MQRLDDGTVIFEGAAETNAYRLLVLKGALKLEILGLKRSRRPSVLSIVKREFGLKGNAQSVLAQYEALLRERGILR